ncbi:hypothetical protein Hokovirus_1_146 [Hokovirus HKV1]|uniref:Uncharacterized protein n=1 Tax=Hokovirus HKV1 TaxID=1977638 RepID=A0A1V0SEX0_9VIRU|nr:hypothetical protein Hokovirus_1_146 [Hokovirus HKV1]
MNKELVNKFLKPSPPVIIYIIFAIIIIIIGFITAIYFGRIGAGLFNILISFLWIALLALVLNFIYNIPQDKFKYGKIIVWIIVIILILIHIISNIATTTGYYALKA